MACYALNLVWGPMQTTADIAGWIGWCVIFAAFFVYIELTI